MKIDDAFFIIVVLFLLWPLINKEMKLRGILLIELLFTIVDVYVI